MIYLDNSATSWPKPPVVTEAMARCVRESCANPGRAGHRMANEAAHIVYDTREAVCELFHATDPLRVVFTSNVTEALNVALIGLLNPGDHVITSSMEHNSMMRPLRLLEKQGVQISVIQCSKEGFIDPGDITKAVKKNTAMIALNHASNVTGTIQPIDEIGRIARENDLLFLIDAAQSGGALEIDMEKEHIDLLGFTGHKSLYGPMGTGGLIIGNRVDINKFKPIKTGGTGSRSSEETQPGFLPDMCESGTLNVVGLAGLSAGIKWIQEKGIDTIRNYEMELIKRLISGLKEIPDVTIYSPCDADRQSATLSFTIEGISTSEAGLILDEQYEILCRVGLHCSPSSHKTIGTFPTGTIRFGLGIFNTEEEVNTAINAVKELTGKR